MHLTSAPWRPDAPPAPWQWAAPQTMPTPPLAGSRHADFAVIGAGLAGLATAYRLRHAAPGTRIVVLEAHPAGAGASGRSTGVAAPGVGAPIPTLRMKYGDEVARRMFAASLDAVEQTLALITDERIDCDLEVPGQLVTAMTPGQDTALRAAAASFEALGFDVPYLDRSALGQVLRTDRYLGALRYRRAGVLDPQRLCRGLRERLLDSGVEVYEHTPVARLDRTDPHLLSCAAGSVRAEHVIVATDAYAAELGVLGRSVVPIDTHVLRTAPLPRALLEELEWAGRETFVDSRTFFNYVRLTAQDRIVFGGGPVSCRTPAGRAAARGSGRVWARLESELHALLPATRHVAVTDRWFGTTGATLDRLPVVGELRRLPGVWFAGGWCGHGVALSVAAGGYLAARLTGSPPPVDWAGLPWVRGRAPGLPPDPFRRWGLRAYIAALDAADRRAVHGAVRPIPVPDRTGASR
jgi:gamma-glutamylputrescine oxidase